MSKTFANESLVALDQQLCFMLYSASRAMTKAYQPMLQDMGVTYPQYLVLMVLWEWDGDSEKQCEATINALGQRLFLDSGTLTPLLKRMEAQGLLSRQRSSDDERKVLLSLLPAGRKVKPKALKWLESSLKTEKIDLETVEELREKLRLLMVSLQN